MEIVAAFPGCGKSWFVKSHPEVSDSDSSQFPKDKFPGNYLEHIRKRSDAGKLTLVSTHEDVRTGLVKNNLAFFLIYPEMELKDEYYKRYKDRAGTGGLNKNNEEWFADLMAEHWENWITQCQQQRECIHRVLKSGEYLGDVLEVRNGQFSLN